MGKIKSFRTYEQQLQILKNRGLIVSDDALALQWLREKNYYRLSAYSLTLRQKDPSTGEDQFFSGASFHTIMELYQFDEQFRATVFRAAAVVEINLKAYVAYYHSRLYGPVGYMDDKNFEDPARHEKFLRGLSKSLGLRKDEPFVLHHHKDLNDVYPIWVIVEVLSFDQISMMYRNLRPEDRAAIAREFYGISSREYIENWTHCAVVARNIAAHGARFYHRQRVNPPARIPKKINRYGTKPFGYIYAIYHLLPMADRAAFAKELEDCFSAHPDAQLSELGFPQNWNDILQTY